MAGHWHNAPYHVIIDIVCATTLRCHSHCGALLPPDGAAAQRHAIVTDMEMPVVVELYYDIVIYKRARGVGCCYVSCRRISYDIRHTAYWRYNGWRARRLAAHNKKSTLATGQNTITIRQSRAVTALPSLP